MTRRLDPDPDLEALIRRLNDTARNAPEELRETPSAFPPVRVSAPPSRWILPARESAAEEWLDQLLARARQRFASDLLLVAGVPAMVRVHGHLAPLGQEALSSDGIASLCAALIPEARRGALSASGSVDFGLTRTSAGRLRCNVHRERDRWSAAIRLLPEAAPDLRSLELPPILERLAALQYGLVLVTGPTGCGKSTTLAALLRRILAERRVHAITIEDPVEYTHSHGQGLVEHVEIGLDVDSFSRALRAALRQTPDVLLIGEMRDAESISMAITAGETGHLVLATLHTGDAPQTIHRILDGYPASQAQQVGVQLSVSLAAIVSQQLLPRKDGKGRVPAVEVLVATPAVRNLIRQGKVAHLRSQIALERNAGMLSLDQSLARLVRAGLVAPEEARARARVPEEFELGLKNPAP